ASSREASSERALSSCAPRASGRAAGSASTTGPRAGATAIDVASTISGRHSATAVAVLSRRRGDAMSSERGRDVFMGVFVGQRKCHTPSRVTAQEYEDWPPYKRARPGGSPRAWEGLPG